MMISRNLKSLRFRVLSGFYEAYLSIEDNIYSPRLETTITRLVVWHREYGDRGRSTGKSQSHRPKPGIVHKVADVSLRWLYICGDEADLS
jgi:hypothetical protein